MVILCCLSFHCGGNEADHSRTLRDGVVVADMLRWANSLKIMQSTEAILFYFKSSKASKAKI